MHGVSGSPRAPAHAWSGTALSPMPVKNQEGNEEKEPGTAEVEGTDNQTGQRADGGHLWCTRGGVSGTPRAPRSTC